MIEYAKKSNDITDDYKLDSILKTSANIFKIQSYFNVYKLEEASKNIDDITFQKNFILDFTPNILLFTSEGNLINFYRPTFHSSNTQYFFETIKDSLLSKQQSLSNRLILEKKFKEKEIDTAELYKLIIQRNEVHLKSQEYINEYALRKGDLTNELAKIINSQEFNINDPIVTYLLNSNNKKQEDWVFQKIILLDNIIENAKIDFNKEDFEKAYKLKIKYQKIANPYLNKQLSNTISADTITINSILTEKEINENFQFYLSIKDKAKIIEFGNLYVTFFKENYKKKRDRYLSNIIEGIEDSKARNLRSKEAKDGYDSSISDILNHVSWSFYENIDDRNELIKALEWSKFSIKLEENPYKLYTYAHLLHKLGRKNKAIKFQKKAILKAENDKKFSKIIGELRKNLIGFQNR